jgi:hypothetical protein
MFPGEGVTRRLMIDEYLARQLESGSLVKRPDREHVQICGLQMIKKMRTANPAKPRAAHSDES